ncbi:Endo-1,4-beta-xylanase B [compost metagenome]
MKREKIAALVSSLKDQGVPIHGIGMQGHWNIQGPSIDEIRAAIELYASLGVQLQITELDLSVFEHSDRRTDLTEPTSEMLELQAERYEQIFELFRAYQKNITAVTFWGAADDYTWLDDFPVKGRKNWPFLFDHNHTPKRAFHQVIKSCK